MRKKLRYVVALFPRVLLTKFAIAVEYNLLAIKLVVDLL